MLLFDRLLLLLRFSAVLSSYRPIVGVLVLWFRVGVVSLVLFGLGTTLHLARREIAAREAFEASLRRVRVLPPSAAPEVSKASIDLALTMFGITVPTSAMAPRLDEDLRDRGLTSRAAFMEQAEVTIGPAAFASWGLLGSTLAHELEVHCRQNFLFISVMDAFGLDGTGEAERQAYLHELRNARRFGLASDDADLIAETMEYYYPDGRRSGPVVAIKRWLARNLIRTSGAF